MYTLYKHVKLNHQKFCGGGLDCVITKTLMFEGLLLKNPYAIIKAFTII